MRSRELLIAGARQTAARFRALFMAMALGMALLVGSASVVGNAIAAQATTLDRDSSLNTLRLLAVAPSGTPRELTADAVGEIQSVAGVTEAIGSSSVGVSLSLDPDGSSSVPTAVTDALGGVFFMLPRFRWTQPQVVMSDAGRIEDAPLAPGEVLLPDSYLGADLAPLVGQSVVMEYTRATGEGQGVPARATTKVVGVFDNSSPVRDGDSAIYANDEDFGTALAALLGAPGGALPPNATYTACLVRTASVADAQTVARELTERGFYVDSVGAAPALPQTLQLLQKINGYIAALLAFFGVGIGATLAGTWSRLRRWDVGVLTALGWAPRNILRTFCGELAAVGAGVGASAAVTGTVLALVGGQLARGHDVLGIAFPDRLALPSPAWLLATVAGVPIVLVAGALPRLVRLSRVEPDDALRRPD